MKFTLDGTGIMRIKNPNSEYVLCSRIEKKSDKVHLECLVFDHAIKEYSEACKLLNETKKVVHKKITINAEQVLSPIPTPKNLIGVAINYNEHGEDVGIAPRPFFFSADPKSICGAFGKIDSSKCTLLDYEVELGIVLRDYIDANTSVNNPDRFIGGYVLINDFTDRAVQISKGSLFNKMAGFSSAKNFPYSKPIGPIVVSKLPSACILELKVKRGESYTTRQNCSIEKMIYSPQRILQELASRMRDPNFCKTLGSDRLYPGDLIMTGTPGGTAYSSSIWDIARAGGKRNFIKKEAVRNDSYLKTSDVVVCSAAGLGFQETNIM